MPLYIASLNSGSNGNCYYIGSEHEAVLIDAGLKCRETEKRMRHLGLSMDKVKAIFISHEHGDHIRGLEVIAKKYRLPVYITPSTLHHAHIQLDAHLVRTFPAHQPISIGSLSVVPFPKLHDASDPHSFTITGDGVTIGVFTDIGAPCTHVVHHFSQCHAAFLEANYDDDMLENGRYPVYLKRRISGDHGHLSNMQALDLFMTHKSSFMSHLLLSHLSKDNNDPDLALALFSRHCGSTNVTVASRYQESPLITIHNGIEENWVGKAQIPASAVVQATLF